MKTKIILGFLVLSSITAIVLGLFWSRAMSSEQEIAAYFSEKQPVYIFYRPSECTVTDLNWEINSVPVLPFIQSQLGSGKWKSILAQQVNKNQISMVFEQNSSFKEEYVDSICHELGIPFKRKLLTIEAADKQWLIREIGSFLVLSNAELDNNSSKTWESTLNNRDRNASFACVIDGEIQEYYCFPKVSKTFIKQKIKDLRVNSLGSLDLGSYNVVPKGVPYFEYVDKDVLVNFYPEWKACPLLEYSESGVIFSSLDQVDFFVFPISDLFSAKEILESLAGGTSETDMPIRELKKVIPGFRKINAIAIENNLVLSTNQGTLELISLSYQMQQGLNTTRFFERMVKNSSEKVHYRWYNRQQMIKPSTFLRLPTNGVYGYAYFRNRDQRMRFVNIGNQDEQIAEVQESKDEVRVLWNFSLNNLQSTFHLNSNPVVGVYNSVDRAFSVVNGLGQILTSITLDENIKSIHPLEKGFLLETFEKLYWVPEQNRDAQRQFKFKGQIESSIASYVWNGEEFITFISEQKLHKLSLKTGKIETLKIPVSINNQLPQLHAFNHKGKLIVGYFSNQQFHALELSGNRWSKESISGEVLYSEKIDGKIHFIEKNQGKAAHKVLSAGEQQIFNSIKPNFAGFTKNNQESIWILRDGRDIFVYRPKARTGTLNTINGAEISGFEPVFSGDQLIGILILDDVQNEIHYFKRNGEETELTSNQKFRGSKFIKIIGNKQIVTFVDGQLVAYEL